MRNKKLIKANQRFMWANIFLGLFIVVVVFVALYFCGIF